jgi:exosortase
VAYHYIVPTASMRNSTTKSSPFLRFSVLGLISLAVWFRPLTSAFALAMSDDQYTQILLIFPISAALVFIDWKSSEPASGWGARIASAFLAIAILVTAAVRWKAVSLSPDAQLSVDMLAFVVWWMAAFVLCFGTRAFRRALFPLCFLLWTVPFPLVLLNPVVSVLQRGSAASAHLLFQAFGIPVAQSGTLLHIPGLTLEVAPECSSIRSSLMLLVTVMVLAHLLLRTFWRKALVVAVAIPLSVAKNGLRIFVLAMLGTRVDPSYLTGKLHRQGGIIYFLIALSATFLLLWILHRGEEEKPKLGSGGSLRMIDRAKP